MAGKSGFSRLWSYLKLLKNPSMFKYQTCHYLNRYVSIRAAQRILKKNQSDYQTYSIKCLDLPTYDGSGQLVHPDIVKWKGSVWFVATPYPYGMEEYENPCLYKGPSLDALKPYACPFYCQKEHKQGTHLSDPAFVIFNEKLHLVFRSTVNRKDDALLVSEYDSDRDTWSEPSQFVSTSSEKLLSPAFFCDSGISMLYADGNGRLIRRGLDGFSNPGESYEASIDGTADGYSIWHLALDNNLNGLFLMKSIAGNSPEFRLFRAGSSDNGNHWNVYAEVEYPDALKQIMKYPHKSCFIPGTDKLLLCFVDKKNRYRLTVL